MNNFIFGKLTLNALPHEWFTIGGTITLGIMLLSIVVFLIKIKRLRWL
jgi:hypothetical protein